LLLRHDVSRPSTAGEGRCACPAARSWLRAALRRAHDRPSGPHDPWSDEVAGHTRASGIHDRASGDQQRGIELRIQSRVWSMTARTEPPARAPTRGSPATDVLSDVLRAIRLSGAVFFSVDAVAPWAFEGPATPAVEAFLRTGVDHVIPFHAIASGS